MASATAPSARYRRKRVASGYCWPLEWGSPSRCKLTCVSRSCSDCRHGMEIALSAIGPPLTKPRCSSTQAGSLLSAIATFANIATSFSSAFDICSGLLLHVLLATPRLIGQVLVVAPLCQERRVGGTGPSRVRNRQRLGDRPNRCHLLGNLGARVAPNASRPRGGALGL